MEETREEHDGRWLRRVGHIVASLALLGVGGTVGYASCQQQQNKRDDYACIVERSVVPPLVAFLMTYFVDWWWSLPLLKNVHPRWVVAVAVLVYGVIRTRNVGASVILVPLPVLLATYMMRGVPMVTDDGDIQLL